MPRSAKQRHNLIGLWSGLGSVAIQESRDVQVATICAGRTFGLARPINWPDRDILVYSASRRRLFLRIALALNDVFYGYNLFLVGQPTQLFGLGYSHIPRFDCLDKLCRTAPQDSFSAGNVPLADLEDLGGSANRQTRRILIGTNRQRGCPRRSERALNFSKVAAVNVPADNKPERIVPNIVVKFRRYANPFARNIATPPVQDFTLVEYEVGFVCSGTGRRGPFWGALV